MSATITSDMIRAIREKTGAGMMDCKKALVENDGNFDEAVDWLRKKGLAAAAKKSSRVAADGLIGIAVLNGDQAAAIVEVNAETDFVAKNEKFQNLVRKITNSAATSKAKDVETLLAQTIEGETVRDAVSNLIAVVGENMTVRRLAHVAAENGVVATYVHNSAAPGLGKIGVVVALESTGDRAKLKEFGKKLAMHIAAAAPKYVRIEDVPAHEIEHEKSILLEQIKDSGRPANVLEKMVEGRLRKFYEEVVLLKQAYVMDNKKDIAAAVDEFAKELGAPVTVKTFTKFVLGEGIEKTEVDFEEEVKAMSHGA